MARLRTIIAVPFAGLAVATYFMGIDDLQDANAAVRDVTTELKAVAAKRRFARARVAPEPIYQPVADVTPALIPPALPEDERRLLDLRAGPETGKLEAAPPVELARREPAAEATGASDPAAPPAPEAAASRPADVAAPETEAAPTEAFTGRATMPAVRKAIRARDYAAAAAMLQTDDLRGDPEAMYLLASLYRNGDGVARDDERAFALMSAAAGAGHLEAEFSLARMYLSGRGVAADRGQAQLWLARAAEAGHVGATEALVSLMTQAIPLPEAAEDAVPAAPQVAASDIAGRQGKSPLMEAAERGETRTLARLLEAGEPADARDAEGRTPLMLAAAGGHGEAVRMLIDRGAQPSATDAEGQSALMYAARAGKDPVVETLLRSGSDPALRDAAGHTASDLAFLAGRCGAGAALFSGAATEDVELAVLERCGAPDLAALDAKGFGFRADDGRGRGPLWYAAQAGNTDAVRFLIGKGYTGDAAALSPLLVAINGAHAEIALMLIENGSDIEARTNSGNTPLLIAATRGLPGIVERLVGEGAKIDHRNADGYSALMLAAKFGREDIVRFLIASGADPTLRNIKRERAVDVAQAAGFAEIAALLN